MALNKIAIIDFDGTLFAGESMPYIWKRYGELGYSKVKQMIALSKIMVVKLLSKRKMFKKITVETYRDNSTMHLLKMFKGFTEKDMDKFFNEIYDSVENKLNKYVVKRIKELHLDNYKIIVISGGFDTLVKMIANSLDIEYSIGTKFNYLDNGLIDINKRLNIIKKDKKLEELFKIYPKETIDYENSYSFSDSIVDLDILNVVRNKEIINPDTRLEKIAKENSWLITVTE